jgi:hypothetical protein
MSIRVRTGRVFVHHLKALAAAMVAVIASVAMLTTPAAATTGPSVTAVDASIGSTSALLP